MEAKEFKVMLKELKNVVAQTERAFTRMCGAKTKVQALGAFVPASKASAAFEERWGNPGEQPLVAEQAIEVLAWVDIRLIWMDAAVVLSQLKFLSASEQVKE